MTPTLPSSSGASPVSAAIAVVQPPELSPMIADPIGSRLYFAGVRPQPADRRLDVVQLTRETAPASSNGSTRSRPRSLPGAAAPRRRRGSLAGVRHPRRAARPHHDGRPAARGAGQVQVKLVPVARGWFRRRVSIPRASPAALPAPLPPLSDRLGLRAPSLALPCHARAEAKEKRRRSASAGRWRASWLTLMITRITSEVDPRSRACDDGEFISSCVERADSAVPVHRRWEGTVAPDAGEARLDRQVRAPLQTGSNRAQAIRQGT